MHTWLRIAVMSSCAAVGVAVALAVASRKPRVHDHKPAATAYSQASSTKTAPSAAVPPAPVPDPTVEAVPILAPYRDPVARQVGQLEETIQQIEESSQRRDRSLHRAIAALQEQNELTPAKQAQPTGAEPLPPVESPQGPAESSPSRMAPTVADVRRAEGDDGLTINTQDSDIRAVLELISKATGLNIVASKRVQGTVTANLKNVDIETALGAILKSTGFTAAREGNIIYVGEPLDLQLMNQAQDRIVTRIYRPNYVKAADLQALFTSLLSTDGKITVSSPAQTDLPADQQKTGGNGFAGADAIVVRDYETVLAQLDEIFAEVDSKPKQVAIEAMILSVKLGDKFKFGVNFETLRDHANVRLVSGAPAASLGNISVTDGQLNFGFLDGSLSTFINCLEEIGDTNVIASPRLTCLNKQRAEIQIGEELGYVSTTVTESSSTQTINFLDVGTLLRIRPYIGNDGLIRLEVHPELSTGSVIVQQGLSLPQKAVTQVTTNVLCPDGCTAVIGGLIREDLTTTTQQLPVLGNMPYVGWLFRTKKHGIDRNEIIVLITPRIVSEPFMCQEGMKYGNQFTDRQNVYFDKMSPLTKRHLGKHHLRVARAAYNAGDQETAMKQVNLAIHYDPQSRDAVVLRNEIVAAGGFEDESIHEYLHRGLLPLSGRHLDYSRRGSPWKEFEGFGPLEPSSTNDPGMPGPTRTIVKPLPRPNNVFAPESSPATSRAQPVEIMPAPLPPIPGAELP